MFRQHTFVSSASSRREVISYWRKYVTVALINRVRDLSFGDTRGCLPISQVDDRKTSDTRGLTDRPDMTVAVYRVQRKATTQSHKLCTTACKLRFCH